MGMSNMQVQQPMQQGGGKGMSNGMPGQQAGIGDDFVPRNNNNAGFNRAMDMIGLPNNHLPNQQMGLQSENNIRRTAGMMDPGKMQEMQGQTGGMQGQMGGKGGMQQPRFGQANPYSNTVKPMDNASIMPSQGGVGKGAGGGKGGQAGGYPKAATNFQYTLPQQQPAQTQQPAPAQQQAPGFQGY